MPGARHPLFAARGPLRSKLQLMAMADNPYNEVLLIPSDLTSSLVGLDGHFPDVTSVFPNGPIG